ncbi:MAG: hypothetical protein KBT68_02605 [bacterium]|nr:hypothetical protein [Candidatus Colisoma equi]
MAAFRELFLLALIPALGFADALEISRVTDLSTLATWKVYVDGVQKPYYTLGVDGSHLTVSGDPGLIIVVE